MAAVIFNFVRLLEKPMLSEKVQFVNSSSCWMEKRRLKTTVGLPPSWQPSLEAFSFFLVECVWSGTGGRGYEWWLGRGYEPPQSWNKSWWFTLVFSSSFTSTSDCSVRVKSRSTISVSTRMSLWQDIKGWINSSNLHGSPGQTEPDVTEGRGEEKGGEERGGDDHSWEWKGYCGVRGLSRGGLRWKRVEWSDMGWVGLTQDEGLDQGRGGEQREARNPGWAWGISENVPVSERRAVVE